MTPSFTTFLIKSQLLANQELQGQGSFCEKSIAPEMFICFFRILAQGNLPSPVKMHIYHSCVLDANFHTISLMTHTFLGGDVVTMSRGVLMTAMQGWNSQLWFSSTSMALLPGVILQQARMERKPLQKKHQPTLTTPHFKVSLSRGLQYS